MQLANTLSLPKSIASRLFVFRIKLASPNFKIHQMFEILSSYKTHDTVAGQKIFNKIKSQI